MGNKQTQIIKPYLGTSKRSKRSEDQWKQELEEWFRIAPYITTSDFFHYYCKNQEAAWQMADWMVRNEWIFAGDFKPQRYYRTQEKADKAIAEHTKTKRAHWYKLQKKPRPRSTSTSSNFPEAFIQNTHEKAVTEPQNEHSVDLSNFRYQNKSNSPTTLRRLGGNFKPRYKHGRIVGVENDFCCLPFVRPDMNNMMISAYMVGSGAFDIPCLNYGDLGLRVHYIYGPSFFDCLRNVTRIASHRTYFAFHIPISDPEEFDKLPHKNKCKRRTISVNGIKISYEIYKGGAVKIKPKLDESPIPPSSITAFQETIRSSLPFASPPTETWDIIATDGNFDLDVTSQDWSKDFRSMVFLSRA